MFWRQNWANRRKKHFSCLQSQPLYQCKRLWFSSNWANITLQYLYCGNRLFISHLHKLHIKIVILQHEAIDNLILCCSVCFQTFSREYLTLPSLKSQEKKEPKSSQVHQASTFLNLQSSSKKSSMVSSDSIINPWRCGPRPSSIMENNISPFTSARRCPRRACTWTKVRIYGSRMMGVENKPWSMIHLSQFAPVLLLIISCQMAILLPRNRGAAIWVLPPSGGLPFPNSRRHQTNPNV